jgi:hypothetical protein
MGDRDGESGAADSKSEEEELGWKRTVGDSNSEELGVR